MTKIRIGHFTKEGMWVTNKQIKRYSTLKKKEKKPQCEVTETPEQAVGKHSTCKIPTEVTPQAVGYLEIDIFNFLIAQ